MGILDRLSPTAQFIEVLEWLDDSSDTMLYRFPVRDQEIKNGAQLIVRESQAAVFVHEGQIADVFGPGRYSVEGGNTPILSKLGAWSAMRKPRRAPHCRLPRNSSRPSTIARRAGSLRPTSLRPRSQLRQRRGCATRRQGRHPGVSDSVRLLDQPDPPESGGSLS